MTSSIRAFVRLDAAKTHAERLAKRLGGFDGAALRAVVVPIAGSVLGIESLDFFRGVGCQTMCRDYSAALGFAKRLWRVVKARIKDRRVAAQRGAAELRLVALLQEVRLLDDVGDDGVLAQAVGYGDGDADLVAHLVVASTTTALVLDAAARRAGQGPLLDWSKMYGAACEFGFYVVMVTSICGFVRLKDNTPHKNELGCYVTLVVTRAHAAEFNMTSSAQLILMQGKEPDEVFGISVGLVQHLEQVGGEGQLPISATLLVPEPVAGLDDDDDDDFDFDAVPEFDPVLLDEGTLDVSDMRYVRPTGVAAYVDRVSDYRRAWAKVIAADVADAKSPGQRRPKFVRKARRGDDMYGGPLGDADRRDLDSDACIKCPYDLNLFTKDGLVGELERVRDKCGQLQTAGIDLAGDKRRVIWVVVLRTTRVDEVQELPALALRRVSCPFKAIHVGSLAATVAAFEELVRGKSLHLLLSLALTCREKWRSHLPASGVAHGRFVFEALTFNETAPCYLVLYLHRFRAWLTSRWPSLMLGLPYRSALYYDNEDGTLDLVSESAASRRGSTFNALPAFPPRARLFTDRASYTDAPDTSDNFDVLDIELLRPYLRNHDGDECLTPEEFVRQMSTL